ncbi:MAG: hypothetical protein AAGF94_18580 [Pseudomonadota bacterium]
MPLLIILFIILLVWLAVTFRARQSVRDCRWRENHEKDSPEGRYFICMNCGAQTFSEDYKPPPVCLRPSEGKE